MTKKIYRDEGPCDHWVAESKEQALELYEAHYGFQDPDFENDPDFFTEIQPDDAIEMYMVDEPLAEKYQIPDGGAVTLENGYLCISATAQQWLAHLPDDVANPWLVGEW